MAARVKLAALILLSGTAAWLVYRNLLHTPAPAVATSRPALAGRQDPVGQAPGVGNTPAGQARGARNRERQPFSNLDPTLRLDLLEATRAVEYAGGSRNIFQFYTPPAPPTPTPETSDTSAQPLAPPAPPPPPPLPFKFYGTAQRPGAPQKKAFLTGAENEIFIGEEGDVVGNYKITRIGVNSIELQDTRTLEIRQLPLLEE